MANLRLIGPSRAGHPRLDVDRSAHQPPLELWGGLECSVVRVGDAYRDQLAETGHRTREGDLEAVAALGVRALRYPVLWESVAPSHPDRCDWTWHDHRLARVRDLGMRAIVGLVHHGSGPAYTNLLDPAFPELLARHAGAVARRYPWLDHFTPVNEPLTTARFSALYGHWYPHHASPDAFSRAIVNQCLAVQLAMRAIREVTPHAQLVQTEDLGRTFSTPRMAHQAAHDNERRWLSFDLLCGRVTRAHPWWPMLVGHGVPERSLDLLAAGDAAPDVVGINHYATSDRYLDENLDRYPVASHGGNGREAYADVEAVRVLPADQLGPEARLAEAWERYGRPLAVTEAHLGCTRDEQVRWLAEVWCAAERLRARGAEVRAVTVWSLFGAVDWCSLLTRREGVYEPGAFDLRGPTPRLTAIGRAAAELAHTGRITHPVLDGPGWWRRDERYYHRPRGARAERRAGAGAPPRPVLIVGGTGPLGQTVGHAFARLCSIRGLAHMSTTDLDPATAGAMLDHHRPWAVVDAASLGGAGAEPERCSRADVARAEALARACAERGVGLASFSSDRVFDGRKGLPYTEADPVSPACPLGEAQAEAERRVAEAHSGALLVRSAALFGPGDWGSFAASVLESLRRGRPLRPGAGVVSPTYGPDLAQATLDLLVDGESGVWHLVNEGAVSWAEFASLLAAAAGQEPLPDWLEPALPDEPVTALASGRGQLLPSLADAAGRFVHEHRQAADREAVPPHAYPETPLQAAE